MPIRTGVGLHGPLNHLRRLWLGLLLLLLLLRRPHLMHGHLLLLLLGHLVGRQAHLVGLHRHVLLMHVVLVMLLLQHLLLLQVVLLRQHRVHLRRHPLRHVLRRLGHHGLLHEVRLRWHVRRLVRLLHGVHRGARLLHHGRWEGGIGAGRRVRGGVREVTAAVRVWGLRGETTHPCRACVGGWMWSGGLT